MDDLDAMFETIGWLKKKNGKTVKPVLLAIPAALVWLGYGFFNGQKFAFIFTSVVIVAAIITALVIGLRLVYKKTLVSKKIVGPDPDNFVEQSLLVEWVRNTYEQVCPHANVR